MTRTLLVLSVAWVPCALASEALSVPEQNALVQKYCGVCHYDAHPNGGLSLQHFDAASPDPGVVAMLVSKMKTGAFGAAGVKPRDAKAEEALLAALSPKTAGAEQWTVTRDAQTVTAGIVREVRSSDPKVPEPDSYRLVLTCDSRSHQGVMQITWSPAVPMNGTEMTVTADTGAPATYKVQGTEKMGNGADGSSGPGAVPLNGPIPQQSLTIRGAFPNETVVFPFTDLPGAARSELANCFDRSESARRL